MASHRTKNGRTSARRAQRFAVDLPILYRELGRQDWRESRTVNISASGVLFRVAETLRPNTAIEVQLTLPVAIPGEAAARIGCRGTVVRAQPVEGSEKSFVLAASFSHYRFEPRRSNTGDDDTELAAT